MSLLSFFNKPDGTGGGKEIPVNNVAAVPQNEDKAADQKTKEEPPQQNKIQSGAPDAPTPSSEPVPEIITNDVEMSEANPSKKSAPSEPAVAQVAHEEEEMAVETTPAASPKKAKSNKKKRVRAEDKDEDYSDSVSKTPSKSVDALSSSAEGGESSPKKRKVKLTPEEREAINAEKARKKMEKDAEAEAKKKQREEEKQKREEEKKRKEQEKLDKQKKKEEEKRLKQEKLEVDKAAKEAEKSAKDAEKAAKEAEKKKKEEEKEREKKKAEEAKQKQASFFTSWTKKASDVKQNDEVEAAKSPYVTVGEFVAFQPAPGATLAPICRANRELSADELTKLEASIKLGTNEHSLLVDEFKKRVQCVKRASRRAILSEREARVKKTVDIDFSAKGEADVEKMKWLILNAQMKLLKFHENVRPEYWGTFCKTSTIISPRHPFKEDTELLEYDYDSDEDWEEEADAESLDGSDKEDEVIELDGEKHNADEYDFDEFLVADGYLSDGEGKDSADSDAEDADGAKLDPTELLEKTKQNLKKRAGDKQIVVAIGVVRDLSLLDKKSRGILDGHCIRSLRGLGPIKVYDENNAPKDSALNSWAHRDSNAAGVGSANATPKKGGPKAKPMPESLMPEFIRSIHGSFTSKDALIAQFLEKHDEVSKLQLTKKFGDISAKEKREGWPRAAHFVKAELLQQYNVEDVQPPAPAPAPAPSVPASPAKSNIVEKPAASPITSFFGAKSGQQLATTTTSQSESEAPKQPAVEVVTL